LLNKLGLLLQIEAAITDVTVVAATATAIANIVIVVMCIVDVELWHELMLFIH